MMNIKKVGIIGAGTMGCGIAAQLANANIPVVLLDIVTPDLPPEEQHDPAARNRLVQTLFNRMATGKPPQLGHPNRAKMITPGNTEDDFGLLAECDWVIEVIIEKLAPKQALMQRLQATCHPNAIISSNTSGIPIAEIAADCEPHFRKRFLGTHFFNPPRYLKLLELIPTQDTAPEVVEMMKQFGHETLGKTVVICKDTPNFIANRFGSVTTAYIVETVLSGGYSVAETDLLLGELIGRPKTAFFRLSDLIGLDVRRNVWENLYPAIPADPYREGLKNPAAWALFDEMTERGWLGNKSGQGFYKKMMVDGQREFWTLDLTDFDYKPAEKSSFASVNAVKKNRNTVERIQALLAADDRGAQLVKKVIFNMFAYAAHVAPQIAYSLKDVDRAITGGFNYEFGAFELWDALGVADTAAQMKANGFEVAAWVEHMLAAGHERFYVGDSVYSFTSQQYEPAPIDPLHIPIAQLRAEKDPIASNERDRKSVV